MRKKRAMIFNHATLFLITNVTAGMGRYSSAYYIQQVVISIRIASCPLLTLACVCVLQSITTCGPVGLTPPLAAWPSCCFQ